MRDQARISRILDKLERVWINVPDWRLNQLIVNLMKQKNPNLVCPEVFYFEDDMLEKLLDGIVEEPDVK